MLPAKYLSSYECHRRPLVSHRIARAVPQPIGFTQVRVVNLHGASEDDGYVYNVVQLDVSQGHAPTWRVHIANDFENWTVEVVQIGVCWTQ